jgi:D-3-phosphoglycerate dehydrogenase
MGQESFHGVELKDKTLGVVGFGKIGMEVAKRARSFQMNVVVYDPFVSDRLAQDLRRQAGLIGRCLRSRTSLPCTSHWLRQRVIGQCRLHCKMKDGVRIINTARRC